MASGQTHTTSWALKFLSIVCRGNCPTRTPSCRPGPGESGLGGNCRAHWSPLSSGNVCACWGWSKATRPSCSLLHSFTFIGFNTKLSPTPQEMLASQLAKSSSQPINLFRLLAPGDLEYTPPPPHCLCREADWTSAVTASGLEPGIPGISRSLEQGWAERGSRALGGASVSGPCWAGLGQGGLGKLA